MSSRSPSTISATLDEVDTPTALYLSCTPGGGSVVGVCDRDGRIHGVGAVLLFPGAIALLETKWEARVALRIYLVGGGGALLGALLRVGNIGHTAL